MSQQILQRLQVGIQSSGQVRRHGMAQAVGADCHAQAVRQAFESGRHLFWGQFAPAVARLERLYPKDLALFEMLMPGAGRPKQVAQILFALRRDGDFPFAPGFAALHRQQNGFAVKIKVAPAERGQLAAAHAGVI